jgi:hypothetical protein
MAYQTILPKALAARGLTVELVPGWETRGSSAFSPGGAVCHWTAGPKKSATRPSLNIVVNGRAGLPGPLCNVYLDRNGVAVVVAAGRANHAGVGSWRGLTGNSAVFGTEAEAAGPEDWTDAQRIAYPRVNAAYADIGGFGADMVCGHSEWATPTGRKSDVNGYTMADMRTAVAQILAGNPAATMEEQDMTGDQATALAEVHWMLSQIKPQTDRLPAIQTATDQVHWGVLDDTQGLRTAVSGLYAKLTDLDTAGGVTAADVAALIPEGIAAEVADELQRRLAS